MAHDAGIDLHVWVDETRPRNQGAALTAWELGRHGVAHTVIADNAGGHLMQHGEVDLVIVGTDRVTRTRRRREQDRHLPEGAGGARQRRAVLGRAAVHHDRLDGVGRRGRDPDRGAQRGRGDDGHGPGTRWIKHGMNERDADSAEEWMTKTGRVRAEKVDSNQDPLGN